MYKKSDFKIDVSEKLELVCKKINTETPIQNREAFIECVKEIKDAIDAIAVTELGYKSELKYNLEYIFEPIGAVDSFTSVVIYVEGIGVTDSRLGKYAKYNFRVQADNIYKDIIVNLLGYYEKIETGLKLLVNLDEFNAVIKDLLQRNAVQTVKDRLDLQLEEEEVDFESIVSKTSLSFGLGQDFLDISELHTLIGLREEVIMDLGSNAIFDTAFTGRAEASRAEFAKILDIFVQPYGLVKVNDVRTKDLGIYTREDLHTVMRRSFNTPLANLERGLGYYETNGENGIFSIIEKKAIKESDMKESTEDLIYIDNLNITEEEAKQGLNKIEISFRIFPFYKDTNEPSDDTLIQIWNSLNK